MKHYHLLRGDRSPTSGFSGRARARAAEPSVRLQKFHKEYRTTTPPERVMEQT